MIWIGLSVSTGFWARVNFLSESSNFGCKFEKKTITKCPYIYFAGKFSARYKTYGLLSVNFRDYYLLFTFKLLQYCIDK